MALTTKQQRFVEEYCVDFNATQAAIRAGYSEKTAYNAGWQNVRKCEIAEAVQKRLNELAMDAEEALKRLADIARGSVEPFMDADEDGNVYINLGTDEAKANYRLLKKVKQTKTKTTGKDDYEREEVRTEFELYDAKSAIVDILKIHGKFVDRIDHTTDGKALTQLIIHRGSSSD